MTKDVHPPARAGLPGWKLWVARLGRVAVGVVLLVAAVMKAIDAPGFASQIGTYGWLPEAWNYAAALLFITVEFLLGAALVVDALPRPATAGAGLLLLLFLVVLTEAWYTERTVHCGCFGELTSFTPGQEALLDIGYLVLLVPTFLWGARPSHGRWRMAMVAASVLAGVGLALTAPSLPLDDLLTRMSPGASVEDLGMEVLVPEQGAVLVALLDLDDESSQEAVQALNELMLDVLDVEVLGFAAAGADARFTFTMEQAAGFPVEEIGAGTIGALARHLPRFAAVVDGEVAAVWNMQPPDPDALRSALEGGTQ